MQTTIALGRCTSLAPARSHRPALRKPLLGRYLAADRRTHSSRSAVSVSAAQEALLIPLVLTQSSTVLTSAVQALQASPRLALAAAGLLAMIQVLAQRIHLQSVQASVWGKQQQRTGDASGSERESPPGEQAASQPTFTAVTPGDVQRYLDLAKLRREGANKLIARLATYSIFLAVKESKPRLLRYLEAGELCRAREAAGSSLDADDAVAQLVSSRAGCLMNPGSGRTPAAADSGTVQILMQEVATRAALEQINAVSAAVDASRPERTL